MAKKELEEIIVSKVADFKTASDEMKMVIARKYMRKIIKENNDEINALIDVFCKHNQLGKLETSRVYAQIKGAFGYSFSQSNTNALKSYLNASSNPKNPKLVDIMDLYGLYCFNEFQKVFIKTFKERSIASFSTSKDIADLVANLFKWKFNKEGGAGKNMPEPGKYNYTNYQVPSYNKQGKFMNNWCVCFKGRAIKVDESNLSNYTLNISPAPEAHVKMFIKAQLAKSFSEILGIDVNSRKQIMPHQVIVTFELDEIDFDKRKLQYDTALENKKNPYFVLNETRRNAILEIKEQKRELEDVIKEYEESVVIYYDKVRFVKGSSERLFFDSDEIPVERYENYSGKGSIFVYQDTKDIAGGTIYEGEFVNDELELTPIAEEEYYSKYIENQYVNYDAFIDEDNFLNYKNEKFTKENFSKQKYFTNDEYVLDRWVNDKSEIFTYQGTTDFATPSKIGIMNTDGEYDFCPYDEDPEYNE